MSIFERPSERFKGFWFSQNLWINSFGSDNLPQQQDECRCCHQIGFATILGPKMSENRDQNLYKNELESKVAFNFRLSLIFATMCPDFGVQFFSIFSLSGLAVWWKFGFRDKVALGKPLGLIFEPFVVIFCSVVVAFWKILCAFRDGQAASWRDCHTPRHAFCWRCVVSVNS